MGETETETGDPLSRPLKGAIERRLYSFITYYIDGLIFEPKIKNKEETEGVSISLLSWVLLLSTVHIYTKFITQCSLHNVHYTISF